MTKLSLVLFLLVAPAWGVTVKGGPAFGPLTTYAKKCADLMTAELAMNVIAPPVHLNFKLADSPYAFSVDGGNVAIAYQQAYDPLQVALVDLYSAEVTQVMIRNDGPSYRWNRPVSESARLMVGAVVGRGGFEVFDSHRDHLAVIPEPSRSVFDKAPLPPGATSFWSGSSPVSVNHGFVLLVRGEKLPGGHARVAARFADWRPETGRALAIGDVAGDTLDIVRNPISLEAQRVAVLDQRRRLRLLSLDELQNRLKPAAGWRARLRRPERFEHAAEVAIPSGESVQRAFWLSGRPELVTVTDQAVRAWSGVTGKELAGVAVGAELSAEQIGTQPVLLVRTPESTLIYDLDRKTVVHHFEGDQHVRWFGEAEPILQTSGGEIFELADGEDGHILLPTGVRSRLDPRSNVLSSFETDAGKFIVAAGYESGAGTRTFRIDLHDVHGQSPSTPVASRAFNMFWNAAAQVSPDGHYLIFSLDGVRSVLVNLRKWAREMTDRPAPIPVEAPSHDFDAAAG